MNATASLVEQIRQGGANRDVMLMAAGGLLPVPPGELIPLQIELTHHSDPEVVERAQQALRALEPRIVVEFIRDGAPLVVLNYLALESDQPSILEAILRRRDIPPGLLIAIAPNLTEDLQEQLLLRQDVIREEPRILEALERNTRLSSYARRRIQEYRDHLLEKKKPEAPAGHKIVEASDEEVQQAIEAAKAAKAAKAASDAEKQEGELESKPEETTGLTDAQIRALPIPVRLKLARQSPGRTLRNILVRDSNVVVSTSCLHASNWSDQEVEQICGSRNIHEDVLMGVSRNRQWMSRYAIINAFLRNPKAPISKSTKLVPRLSVRDLRDLGRDRNVPDVIRQTANRLYRIKLG
jgi:hypothetical protein